MRFLIASIITIFFTNAFANENLAKEIIVKNITTKIESVLKSSIEAEVFLNEDISKAIKFLQSSKITWADYYSEKPFVIDDELRLSENLGFKGTLEDRTRLVTTILFNIKRQLDGSNDFIPEFRIKIFSKKFATEVFKTPSCSISIEELKELHPSIRKDAFALSSKMISKHQYSYSSKSKWVLYISAKETSDPECGGKNRNIYTLQGYLINTLTSEIIKTNNGVGTSCEYSSKHYQKALDQFINSFKLPNCLSDSDY